MKASSRTTLGIVLFIPLAAVLLVTFACLPGPVGDPEQSKVDEQLVGAWRAEPTDPGDKSLIVALLRPWDAHTYLLQYIAVETKEGKESHEMMPMKAWLTKIGDATFLTAQPMDDLRYAVGDDGQKPYWVVMRLDKTPTGMNIRMVDPGSEFIKGLTKREDLEAAIKAHLNDKIYSSGDATAFKKLGKEDKGFLEALLGKFKSSPDVHLP